MRDKPLVEMVDAVIGPKGNERLVTVAKATADRWPDVYRATETEAGNPTAAAKRATDDTDGSAGETVEPAKEPARRPSTKKTSPQKDDGPQTPPELPTAPTTSSASAAAAIDAGTAGANTEGATPDA